MARPMLADIRAGELRHELEIQQLVSAGEKDEQGSPVEAWATFLSSWWGLVQPDMGSERWRGEQITPTTPHRVTCRYHEGIEASMRVRFGARLFDIVAVQNIDEANVEMVLRCAEVVS